MGCGCPFGLPSLVPFPSPLPPPLLPPLPQGVRLAFPRKTFSCPSSGSVGATISFKMTNVDFDNVVPKHQSELFIPKLSSADLQNLPIGPEFRRPYERSLEAYMIKEAVLDEEFWAAAWLRAESYLEEKSYERYIDSYKRKYAEQEFTALKQRCLGRYGPYIKCLCLLAVKSDDCFVEAKSQERRALRDRVVGTLDLSIRPVSHEEKHPKDFKRATFVEGLEKPSRKCGYIANVCVAVSARRQGIASNLLQAAVEAARNWRLVDLFVHVHPTNTAARQLYQKFGFQVVEDSCSGTSMDCQLLSMNI